MKLKNKPLIISLFMVLSVFSLLFLSTPTYAYDWSEEEIAQTKSRHEYGEYYRMTTFYATSNMDSKRVIKTLAKYLIWNGPFPEEDKANDVYMEIEESGDYLLLTPHMGSSDTLYRYLARPRALESFDGKAEYIIGRTPNDQYLLIVDGDTFKGNLGDIMNSFLTNMSPYIVAPEFYMPYDYANKLDGQISFTNYKNSSGIYTAVCQFLVGFNLTKDGYTPPVLETEDPAVYGGDDNNQIDPTTPTSTGTTQQTTTTQTINSEPANTDSNTLVKTITIILSSIASIILAYFIYLIIKKIITIFKK